MKHIRSLLIVFLFIPGIMPAQYLFRDATIPAHITMPANGAAEAGPGVIIFDLNNDGWEDIYMPGGFDSDKLYLNLGDGTFKNITTPVFAAHSYPYFRTYPRGGIAFDYDNDGFTDLYSVCQNRY